AKRGDEGGVMSIPRGRPCLCHGSQRALFHHSCPIEFSDAIIPIWNDNTGSIARRTYLVCGPGRRTALHARRREAARGSTRADQTHPTARASARGAAVRANASFGPTDVRRGNVARESAARDSCHRGSLVDRSTAERWGDRPLAHRLHAERAPSRVAGADADI